MTIADILNQLLLGFVVGAIGQTLRAIVGIKKAQDEAAALGQSFRDDAFDGTRLATSVLIGGIIGALTILTLSTFKPLPTVDENLFMKLIAAGYAGTDAIEGLMSRYLPGKSEANSRELHSVSNQAIAVKSIVPTPAAYSALSPRVQNPTTNALSLTSPLPSAAGTPASNAHVVDWKFVIELDVSSNVFPACSTPLPDGKSNVDPQFPIADACTANPGNISSGINSYASELAEHYSYAWTNVSASDASKLKVIQDLIGLVDKNLA